MICEGDADKREAHGVTVGALADRADPEAFFAAAESRLAGLDDRIDGEYQRLARRRPADAWAEVESLEAEREEIIFRTEEAFAMLETMTDEDFDGIGMAEGVNESMMHLRAPLPHGWSWPETVPLYELT